MTPQTITELKEFILSSPERRYPITYLDGLTEDHLKLIVHNIEKDRELNAKKSESKNIFSGTKHSIDDIENESYSALQNKINESVGGVDLNALKSNR